MPQIPHSPKWARQLSRIFNSKGGAPQIQVLDDIMPVVPMVADEVDQRWARGDIAWQQGYAISAAGAGTYVYAAFSAKPGYIVGIDAVFVQTAASSQFRAYISQGPLGSGTVGVGIMDSRFEAGLVAPGTIQLVGNLGAAPTTGALYQSNGIFPVGAVLDSDDVWTIVINAANTACWINVWGWEREVDPGTPEAG